jgi:uncharacterized protein YuzE
MNLKHSLATVVILGLTAGVANADILLTTQNAATLGGLSFSRGDVVRYNASTDTASLFFAASNFANPNENIDAIHLLGNGNLLLSTVNNASLAGFSFRDGDIVEWNFQTQTASLFFNEDLFNNNANIDALAMVGNNLVMSTTASETLGGLSFLDGDIVEYNSGADTASILFSESLFAANEDVDAVDILANGNIVLGVRNNAMLGGLSFSDGDFVEYDPSTDTATLLFSESLFGTNENTFGVSAITTIPAPGAVILAVLGLPLVGAMKRRFS